MKHKNSLSSFWLLCVFLTTVCVFDAVCAQNVTDSNDREESNSTNVDILGLLNGLDIQGLIRGMQQDGTLVELANMVATGASADVQINGKCMKDVLTMVQGVLNMDMWAIQMLDAIGKPHSGIIADLDIKWMGSYDECIGVEAVTYSNNTLQSDPVHHFDGKYCTIGLPMPAALKGVNPILQYMQTNIKIGACISDACNTDDMKNIMMLVGKYAFNVSDEYEPDAECQDGIELQDRSIVAICILSVLVLVAVIGTLYDIGLRLNKKPDVKEPVNVPAAHAHTNGGLNGEVKVDLSMVSDGNMNGDVDVKKTTTNGDIVTGTDKTSSDVNKQTQQYSTLEKIFLSFSVYSNGLKILSTNQPRGALTCINGIRFFSMTWVILGHSMSFEAKNAIPYFFNKKSWQWTFYGIYSATVSVDTFFTLSGLLVAYLTLRELSKRGGAKKMNWFMFYFHRYWRLTPAYMLVLMVYATLTRYVGDGPKWPQKDLDACSTYWWTNLLYINNFVARDHMCFGWSWYLANDMQFYILSPLIVVPLYYNAMVGGVVAFLFLGATTAARAIISKHHEYTALFGGFLGPQPKDQDFMTNMYFPAHTRMGPYIIGLLAGYLLYRYKDTLKMKKAWNLLGWFSCMSIIVLIIYGVYPDDGDHYLSVNESVVYVTLHRTGWAIAVSWIIFACATGYGGWINDFLSWSPFAPLGRLSYCSYLVHLVVLQVYLSSTRQNVYLTDFELIYYYIGNVVVSYFVAFGTSLLFEAPMMGLEKVLFKKK